MNDPVTGTTDWTHRLVRLLCRTCAERSLYAPPLWINGPITSSQYGRISPPPEHSAQVYLSKFVQHLLK